MTPGLPLTDWPESVSPAWREWAGENLSKRYDADLLVRLLTLAPSLASTYPGDIPDHGRRILRWLARWDRDVIEGVAAIIEAASFATAPRGVPPA